MLSSAQNVKQTNIMFHDLMTAVKLPYYGGRVSFYGEYSRRVNLRSMTLFLKVNTWVDGITERNLLVINQVVGVLYHDGMTLAMDVTG